MPMKPETADNGRPWFFCGNRYIDDNDRTGA